MKILCCLLLLVPLASAQTSQTSGPAAPPSSPASPSQALSPTPKQIAHMEQMMQDWPDLARYRNANAALPPPAPGENRVVFMGDSITDAWGRQKGVFFPGKPYVNRGISG